MHTKLAIIGGGAAALALSVAIKEQKPELELLIIEAADRVGKKLLATGNGRCNLGNQFAKAQNYHSLQGDAQSFVTPALECFSAEKNAEWFESLGLPLQLELKSGRQYPLSNQAASVLDTLRLTAAALGAKTLTAAPVESIKKQNGGYLLQAGDQTISAETLVLAWGGMSSPQISAAKNQKKLCQDLGLESTKLYPALTQIKTAEKFCAALKGVRINALIKLKQNGQKIQSTTGELQFTEYGISGIPAFELSRAISLNPEAYQIEIDCLPSLATEELELMLQKRQKLKLPLSDFLVGIQNKKLGQQILKLCGFAPLSSCSLELTAKDLQKIARTIKSLELKPTGVTGWQNAQVTAGGLKLAQFDPETLGCRSQKQLYAIGEALDIDGDCGGFNLTWAWSSARLAAKAICAQA